MSEKSWPMEWLIAQDEIESLQADVARLTEERDAARQKAADAGAKSVRLERERWRVRAESAEAEVESLNRDGAMWYRKWAASVEERIEWKRRAESAEAALRTGRELLSALVDATKNDAADKQGVPEFYRRINSTRDHAVEWLAAAREETK